MSWGWGDYWGAFVIAIAAIAGFSGSNIGGWWIFLAVVGVGGYVALNVWQRQIEEREAGAADDEDDEDDEPE